MNKITFYLLILMLPGFSTPLYPSRGTSQDQIGDYEYFDALINTNDSLGNYFAALNASMEGLRLAKENKDSDKEGGYHLKLAKFYYLTEQTEKALSQLRLYALLKSSETERKKFTEMLQLEEAYLEEIDEILEEMNMDKTLIENLQEENKRYHQVQRQIKLAIQIGLGALLVIGLIVSYNRYKSKKDKAKAQIEEANDLQRFKAQVDKLDKQIRKKNLELRRLKKVQQYNLIYARNIQLSLLPPNMDLFVSPGNSFVLHMPKNIASGDFYVFHKAQDKTILAVFDCPGQGLKAAHSTVISHAILRGIISQDISSPSMILTMMDQKLKQENAQSEQGTEMLTGVKMAVCTINNSTKEVEYAGAQFPLFYVQLDKLHFVRGNRFPVGDPHFSDKFYSSNNLRLSDGDMIYLSSDGYYSQLGGKKDKKFMRASLNNLFSSIYKQDIKEQQFILEKVFQEWKAHNEQTDDVLVIGLRL